MKRRCLVKVLKVLCGLVAAGFGVVWIAATTVATRSPQTCTLCRAERMERTLFGYSWHTDRDTEFSRWHQAHRPAHQHEWGRLTCTRGFSILGNTTFFGCGPRHPICQIRPTELTRFAEEADTNTLTVFFEGITSTNRESQLAAVKLAEDRILESLDREFRAQAR